MALKCRSEKVLGSDACAFTCDRERNHSGCHTSFDADDQVVVLWGVNQPTFDQIIKLYKEPSHASSTASAL